MLKVNPTRLRAKRKPMVTRIDILFFVPEETRWSASYFRSSRKYCEKVDHLCRIIKENILIWIVF